LGNNTTKHKVKTNQKKANNNIHQQYSLHMSLVQRNTNKNTTNEKHENKRQLEHGTTTEQ
jgi:hypothetical protein